MAESWCWRQLKKKEMNTINSLLPDLSGESAVDLGSGNGLYVPLILEKKVREVHCIDIAPKMLEAINYPQVRTICANIESYTPQQSYKLTLVAGSLEFLHNPQLFFHKVSTMTQRGGHLILLAPQENLWGQLYRLFHRSHGLNIRLFNLRQLKSWAEDSGLQLEHNVRLFPFSLVMRFRK